MAGCGSAVSNSPASAGRSLDELTAADQPPSFAYVRGGTELVAVDDAGAPRVVWELEVGPVEGGPTFIESIEPISPLQVFAGICCEPAAGRQLSVDLSNGSVEFFPLTVSFPSVSEDGSLLLTGGLTIVADDLGALVAYESGTGVVPRGPSIRPTPGSSLFRPAALANDRAAFIDGDTAAGAGELLVTDLDGETVSASGLEGVRLVDYDGRNDVVVALTYAGPIEEAGQVRGDTLVVLSPDSLDEIGRWTLDQPVSAIDARDGWLLLTGVDGSVASSPIGDIAATRQLVGDDATAATWLR